MVRNGANPILHRILSIFVVLIFVSSIFAIPVFPVFAAGTLSVPAGIHGNGHNVYESRCPDTINGTGVVMKKVAVIADGSGGSVPQGIAYGGGYFFISHGNGRLDRIPEDRIINGNGAFAAADKSGTAQFAHGQAIGFYDGNVWTNSSGNRGTGGGHNLHGPYHAYDPETLNEVKTIYMDGSGGSQNMTFSKDGTIFNVSSGGSGGWGIGDRTVVRKAKFEEGGSWRTTVNFNHCANETQGLQGIGYNPSTDRVVGITNGIIMTFPAQDGFKGSDVHMYPFGCIPESEGICFTEDGKGYALLRGGSGGCNVMEVTLDDSMVNDNEKFDFSFYELASRASVEFQQAVMDGDAEDMLSAESKTGCAATYLGYTKSTSGTLHSTAMRNTQNTIGYAYSAMKDINDTIGSSSGFNAYVNYGRLLTQLGYDEVGTSLTKTVRWFTGGILLVAYFLGLAVPMLSGFIIDFLRAFNPFALLGFGMDKMATYGGSLETLANSLRDIYDSLYDLSLFVMLPLMAAIGFGAALLSNGRNAGRKALNVILEFAAKIALIILALPIVSAGYTHLLDSIDEMHVFGPDSANQLVYSELVDFQGWVENTSLNPPADLDLKWEEDGAVLPKQGIRYGARQINVLAGHENAGTASEPKSRYADDYETGSSSGMSVSLNDYNYSQNDSLSAKVKDVQGLMMRYFHGNVYSSAAYESQVKEEVLKRVADGDVSIKSMILDGTSGSARPYSCTVGNLFGNGTISYSSSGGYKAGEVSGDRLTGSRGISTLGMFNYLTTRFDDSQMLIFGGKTSNSEKVKDAHMSVTTVGSGFYGAALYLQTVISLLCIGIIGVVYGFGFVAASFKRGFKTIAAIPGMMIGSRQAIGAFLKAVILLFAEILLTIVLYAFFCEMILVVNDSFVSIFGG